MWASSLVYHCRFGAGAITDREPGWKCIVLWITSPPSKLFVETEALNEWYPLTHRSFNLQYTYFLSSWYSEPHASSLIYWLEIDPPHAGECVPYNGEIEKIRGAPWDFSHLRGSIVTLLKQNPHHDIYLFGGVESCAGSSHHQLGIQAPFINAILIPLNNSPASLVCYKNNQSGTEDINSFDDLEYRWSQLDGASLDNRVYFLQCDTDTELAPSR